MELQAWTNLPSTVVTYGVDLETDVLQKHMSLHRPLTWYFNRNMELTEMQKWDLLSEGRSQLAKSLLKVNTEDRPALLMLLFVKAGTIPREHARSIDGTFLLDAAEIAFFNVEI